MAWMVCAVFWPLLLVILTSNMAESTNAQQCAMKTKTIYLIRHAESEENQRMQSLNTVVNSLMRFSLPSSKDLSESLKLFNVASQVDTGVSSVGEQQIRHMAEKLAKETFLQSKQVELVMHSPLQRARQTSKGLVQCLAGNDMEEEIRHVSVARVVETALLVERTPQEWMPGNFEGFRQRIRQWEDFALEQPEEKIVVVGHSQFFKSMLNLDFKFGNCHVWEVQLRNIDSTAETDPKYPQMPPRWFGLKQVYDCDYEEQ